MTSRLDQRPSEPRQVGRRAVTRGAAWSIPVVSLAVAAPAMAASGCNMTTGQLSWDVFADDSNQTGKALATTGGTGVTVTISLSGDTNADHNGEVSSAATGGMSKVLRLYDVNHKANTQQVVTLTFSKPVQNISFSLLDIDSNGGAYGDQVIIGTAGWTATKHSNVKGSGTAADPYRGKTTNSPVDGSSSSSNVDLTWPGKLTSVSFKYAQDGKVDGGPFIGISDISFQTIC